MYIDFLDRSKFSHFLIKTLAHLEHQGKYSKNLMVRNQRATVSSSQWHRMHISKRPTLSKVPYTTVVIQNSEMKLRLQTKESDLIQSHLLAFLFCEYSLAFHFVWKRTLLYCLSANMSKEQIFSHQIMMQCSIFTKGDKALGNRNFHFV